MPRPRRCVICQSSKFRKNASGQLVCSEGHINLEYREEVSTADPSQHASQVRRLKKQKRQSKASQGQGNNALYHGNDAAYLHVQALQLILRAQVASLKSSWGLPIELEYIAKDLWAMSLVLHSSTLAPPPLSTPIKNESLLSKDHFGGPEQRGDGDLAHSVIETDDKEDEADNRMRSDSEHSDETDEVDEVLKELEEDLKSSENEDDEDDSMALDDEDPFLSKGSQSKLRKDQLSAQRLDMLDTVVICIVSLYMLRIPVLFVEIIRKIESSTFPYLNAVSVLPQSMLSHIKGSVRSSLSPDFAPTVLYLYKRTLHFVRQIKHSFGVKVPELNVSPVAWYCLRLIGSSPVLYPPLLRLARDLKVNLSLAPPAGSGMNSREQGRKRGELVPPEVRVMACVVMLLKMLYGGDGKERQLSNSAAILHLVPTKDSLLKALVSRRSFYNETFSLSRFANGCNVSKDIADLDDDEIDSYLSFMESNLLVVPPSALSLSDTMSTKQKLISSATDVLSKYVPAPEVIHQHHQSHEKQNSGSNGGLDVKRQEELEEIGTGDIEFWQAFHAAIPKMNYNRQTAVHFTNYASEPHINLVSTSIPAPTLTTTATAAAPLLQPGEDYPIYDSTDVTGVLPKDDMQLVLDEAAKIVGMDFGDGEFGWVVEKMEARGVALMHTQSTAEKRKRKESDAGIESSDNDEANEV